ncbi:MAG: class I SAM-dependent methyltransferase [Planctomycetes bacterium]|nr:class I SAM-dependent methyltransferase [Planctomycetota bacterium]
MSDAVEVAIEEAQERYPQGAELARKLCAVGPLVSGSIPWLLRERSEAFWPMADRLANLSRRLEGSPIESLAEYTVMYLKEQMTFERTGKYSNTDFDEVYKAVYDNPEVMRRFYLEGLMLTHAFWPIHLDIHLFFDEHFLPLVPPAGEGLEVGFGHGLYICDVLKRHPGARTRSFDISQHAREFATRVLQLEGIESDRFALEAADIRQPLPVEARSQEWAVFAEVLEHIPDPQAALHELSRVLAPGAPLFTTTVLNSNAIDHLHQFADAAEVRGMIAKAGFEVVEERVLAVKDYVSNSNDPTVDLAYVCRRAT